MSDLLASYERILLGKLKNDDQSAFTIIFTKYYSDLVRFSFGFTRNSDSSEEIVQEVFLKLWENRSTLDIHTSLKSYLLKNVQNRSIDSLRHTTISNKYAAVVLDHPLLSQNDTEDYIMFSELEASFNQAIASKLGVSVRTVEVRISKALSLLRAELKDYLLIGLIIYYFFK
jgi:RNA polymerase sigma-70 factor (ECF subfamily)